MEFMMTYGWAILIIVIVLAVLFYIGVLNPKNTYASTCVFPPGISCYNFKLMSGNGDLLLDMGPESPAPPTKPTQPTTSPPSQATSR